MSVTKVGPNKYRIFISDGFNLDGSRRRFSKTVETELKGRDLERFLMLAEFDFEDEIKKKDPKFQELAKGTFEAYSIFWTNYKTTHENLAPRTVEEYQKMLDNRILKLIGKKILDKLTNGDMLELMEEIKSSPAKSKTGKLSDKSIKHHHTLLKTMFNDAMKLKILEENPMEGIPVKTPKAILKDNYYDLEDIKKLLSLLPSQPIKYQLACLLALTVGFRIGELIALQWKHIDYDNVKIKIEQAGSYTKKKGSFIKDTKTEHSERIVAFPETLIKLFKDHEEYELMKRELVGENWQGAKDHQDDFIFTQEDGKCIFIGTIPKWFRNFIKKNKLRHITFHGLRHTNATILIAKETPVISIAKNLGHAKTSTTTDFYVHHLESVERKMANVFDDIIEENKGENKEEIKEENNVNNLSGTRTGSRRGNLRLVK